jgi:hypothetical protein
MFGGGDPQAAGEQATAVLVSKSRTNIGGVTHGPIHQPNSCSGRSDSHLDAIVINGALPRMVVLYSANSVLSIAEDHG